MRHVTVCYLLYAEIVTIPEHTFEQNCQVHPVGSHPIDTAGGSGFGVLGCVMGQVFIVPLPEGVHGYTDGTDIYLNESLNAVQMLCALTHEAIHVERGQGTRQLESEEMSVRYETARRLLPLDRIVNVCKSGTLSETAKKLGVTKRVLMDRAATLTDKQASDAGCWECQKCPAIQVRAQLMVGAA